MKKQLMFLVLGLFIFLTPNVVKAQPQSTLPNGSIAYGSTLYLAPDGTVWSGIASKKFRQLGTKRYVDSLFATVSGGGVIAQSGTTIYYDALKTNFSTNRSIFFGIDAGKNSPNADMSVFLGDNAGNGASSSTISNFIGRFAGQGAVSANQSNFFGGYTGQNALNADNSNFMGYSAGNAAQAANNSNFFGQNAGFQATNAANSNFIGYGTGYKATNSLESNFIGKLAGQNANGAPYSNFIGSSAGAGATNAAYANFIGQLAGQNATGASQSNFIGQSAGNAASAATYSNFFGKAAGYAATNATNSNFFGQNAGLGSANASYSNLFGFNAGGSSTTLGTNNIIIGTNLSLPGTTANAINIGGVLFGTGAYGDLTTNSATANIGGKIGINVLNPDAPLHVYTNTDGVGIETGNATGFNLKLSGTSGSGATMKSTIQSYRNGTTANDLIINGVGGRVIIGDSTAVFTGREVIRVNGYFYVKSPVSIFEAGATKITLDNSGVLVANGATVASVQPAGYSSANTTTGAIAFIASGEIRTRTLSNQPTISLKAPDTGGNIEVPQRFSGAQGIIVTYNDITPPTTATSTGLKGEIRRDSTYVYICVADNTWIRFNIVTSW